ncbi:RND transporter [Candidatus Magnetominusculus xianensis]|uniref:RND transporter n=2 Tax=Candidatus Magnetominusculus xianensis TaxID=1748249 RepID=A0ABR5SI28_9BACT|nr:RND transporter [Candidatus Magnetominusculus xianensis]
MGNGEQIMKGQIRAIILIFLVIFTVSGCAKPQESRPQIVPVLTAAVEKKTIPIEIKAIGNVEPYLSVTVLSQVDGTLQQVHFKEGEDVKKGQMLFSVDPRPLIESVRQAEAALLQDKKQLDFYETQAKRYTFLVEKGAVDKNTAEQNQTLALTQAEKVKNDKAQLENAKIKLQYSYIRAEIDGRAGTYLTNIGTSIKTNDTKLVVLNQVTPIYVTFSVPEKELPNIKKYSDKEKLKVSAFPPGFAKDAREGLLTFIDNTVNTQTGMIKLKAVFENKDKYLWPGQFLNVVLTLTTEPDALVVPVSAVQVSQQGQYVFVVKDDMTVATSIVKVAREFGNELVIESGVSAGETVVTDGQLKLKPGFKVMIKKPGDGSDNATAVKTSAPK